MPYYKQFETSESVLVPYCKAKVESKLGRAIDPTQPEAALVDAMASMLADLGVVANEAYNSNFIENTNNPLIIEGIGRNIGIRRQLGEPSKVLLSVKMAAFDGSVLPETVVIPSGTKVSNGGVEFEFVDDLDCTPLTTDGFIVLKAVVQSIDVGSYFVPSFTMTTFVNGNPAGAELLAIENEEDNTFMLGTGVESDASLKQRIMGGLHVSSVAGSASSYREIAKKANTKITDVYVPLVPDIAGEVKLYVLSTDLINVGSQPEVLADVLAELDPENNVPITDTVTVIDAFQATYFLSVGVVLKPEYQHYEVIPFLQDRLRRFANTKQYKLGASITVGEIIAECMAVPGVADVGTYDLYGLTVDKSTYIYIPSITVTYS